MRLLQCRLRGIRYAPKHISVVRRNLHFQKGLLDDLSARGLTAEVTRPIHLSDELKKGQQVVYAGIDPTAKSLHVGHLLPLMCLLHFQLHGHLVITLIGGATGLVGDPSGKAQERTPLRQPIVESNASNLHRSVERFFTFGRYYAEKRLEISKDRIHEPQVLNNIEWLGNLNLLEFLSVAGRHSRVNTMIARDSVQSRMTSHRGISFTEFTYQLLQAYDFYHLYHEKSCKIQVGGSDQWGNILAGLDLIQRASEVVDTTKVSPLPTAFGITTPLLTTASGDKLGKSEGNAVWLDPSLTSVFEFYQFFYKIPDADVERYLRLFTLLPLQHIGGVMDKHKLLPETRVAQRLLANEVTELIHGLDGVTQAQEATRALFETTIKNINPDDVSSALRDDPRFVSCNRDEVIDKPLTLIAAKHGLVQSNAAARRLIDARGLYLNHIPVVAGQTLEPHDLIQGRLAILRAGKDSHLVLDVN